LPFDVMPESFPLVVALLYILSARTSDQTPPRARAAKGAVGILPSWIPLSDDARGQ
jgi:hypothetical protein